jgi:two-component system osmolarity sensor histidine kinase EnvZ
VQTFRALEFEPRAVQAAQQIASLVNLSRAALRYADGINRVTVVKTMSDQEAVKVAPREPKDRWEPYEEDRFTQRIAQELRSRLGPDTLVAKTVNDVPGLWVGFTIEKDPYWLQSDPRRVHTSRSARHGVWVASPAATILGRSIARLIQPLRNLCLPPRIRDGEFEASSTRTR